MLIEPKKKRNISKERKMKKFVKVNLHKNTATCEYVEWTTEGNEKKNILNWVRVVFIFHVCIIIITI